MKLNLFLLVLLAATVAANLGINDNPARRNFEVMPEMVYSAAAESFTENPNFADGKTLQPPPQGTIARGARPLPYAATPEDAARAGRELTAPEPSAADLARGAEMYQVFCRPCHGAGGKGDGAVAMRGFPPPPSFFADRAMQLADGQMFHIVTYGQNNMPSHAAQIEPADRWRIIAHVRSLQESQGGAQQ